MHLSSLRGARLCAAASTLVLATSLAPAAFAQDASRLSGATLEEIVVTAQKREENLQDVPISVTAVSAASLQNANVESVADLSKLVSAVVFQKQSGNINVFMRGVGNPASAIGNESSVAVYIDGVYYARLSPVLLDLNNVARIEVLQGPQGTLFGRNADAGLISVITRDPTQSPALKAEIGYANYNTFSASLYAGGGITENLAADIAIRGLYQKDGWGKNLFNGKDFGRIESQAYRTKWVYTPTDATKVTLAADFARSIDTQNVFGTQFIGTHGNFLPPLDTIYPPLASVYDEFTDGLNKAWDTSWGGSLRLEQDFGAVRLVSTSAYRGLKSVYQADADRTPQPFFHPSLPSTQNQASQELQLSSNTPDSRLNWTVGGFYMRLRAQYNPIRFTGAQWPLAFGIPGAEFHVYARQVVKTRAAYAQATYALSDDTNITGGIRYTSDKVSANGHNDIVAPALGLSINTTPPALAAARETFNKVTFRVAVDHDFSDNLMAYASFNRGFKAGVYNLLPFTPPAVKPEILDAYEVGAKSQLFENRLRLNVSAFYYDVKNLQVQRFDGASIVLINAATARTKGVEATADAAFTSQLSGHFAVTLLDAKYKRFAGAPGANPQPPFGNGPLLPIDASGNRLPLAPKVSFTGGLNYTIPSAMGEWQVAGNYAYKSAVYFEPDNVVRQGGYGLLDGRVSFTPAGNERVKISVWGQNLTKETYYNFVTTQGDRSGTIVLPGAPRTYGVTLAYEL